MEPKQYIQPKFVRQPKDELNLNPLSANGRLDAVSFVLSLGGLCCVLFYAMFVVRGPLEMARSSFDVQRAQVYYAVWVLFSILGFWMVTNTFIKRWQGIVGVAKLGKFYRSLLRLSLLSPLLSIWITGLTVAHVKTKREGLPLIDLSRWLLVALSLGFFHVGVLGWRYSQGEVKFIDGVVPHLAHPASPDASLRAVLPPGTILPLLPGEGFMLHAFPYVNPLGKMMLSVYDDFIRMRALYTEVSSPASPLCKKRLGYVGIEVKDCFFYNFRLVSEKYPFTTPIIAFWFETKYRQDLPPPPPPLANAEEPESPLQRFVPVMLTINNLLSVMETGAGSQSRLAFLHPTGLLRFFASPDIPMLSLGQDAQRVLLSAKAVPLLKPRLLQLREQFDLMRAHVPPKAGDDVAIELADLQGRLNGLERDPLSINQLETSAEATSVNSNGGADQKF